jgi:hypothetical protein
MDKVKLMRDKFEVDFENEMKKSLTHEISKEVYKKIAVKSHDVSTNVFQHYFPTSSEIEYSTDLMIYNREELFELFYSFNKLDEISREKIVKFISPNEEEYTNQKRFDVLEGILKGDISPFES